MKKSLRQILYGFVFIFLSIRVGVDLLADPIGFLLIAVGCYKMSELFKDGKTAAFIASVLVILSIPSVFIDFNLVESGAWHYYSNFLFTGEIVLTFYLFRMLKAIAQFNGDSQLEQRTQRLFNLYIPINLCMLAIAAFLTAFESESIQGLSFMLLLVILGLNIAFIILLNTFQKGLPSELQVPKENEESKAF